MVEAPLPAYDLSYTQCYDSDTEEAVWKVTTHSEYRRHHAPSIPQIGITDPTMASAALIYKHENDTHLFLSNCSHSFEPDGQVNILLGASWQLKGHLI